MKRDLPLRIAVAGLLAATSGCMTSASRMAALPEGTRFTADRDASSTVAARLLADGNYGLAIEMYRRMLAATPDNAEALQGLALCYDRLRRYDLSDGYFQKALALAPRNEAFYRAYAASLTAQGRQDEAASLDVDRRAMLAVTAPEVAPQPAVAPGPAATGPSVPVLAGVAAVPPAPRPVPPGGQRLEQLALGVVRLILPSDPGPVGTSAVSIPIPPRASAVAPKPAAGPPAPGALRNTMVVNAIARKGVAGRVRSYLAGKGWQPLDRGDSGLRIATSRILYPPAAEATARKLAQAVPFPTRLYAVAKANRVQLLVGGNAFRFDARRAGRR